MLLDTLVSSKPYLSHRLVDGGVRPRRRCGHVRWRRLQGRPRQRTPSYRPWSALHDAEVSRRATVVGGDELGDPVDGLRLDAKVAVRCVGIALVRLGRIAAG